MVGVENVLRIAGASRSTLPFLRRLPAPTGPENLRHPPFPRRAAPTDRGLVAVAVCDESELAHARVCSALEVAVDCRR